VLRAVRYGKQPAGFRPRLQGCSRWLQWAGPSRTQMLVSLALGDSGPMGEDMLFKKLFQMLVVGGAVMGAVSGCATTSGASDSTDAKAPPPAAPPPPSGMGGGARGW